MRKILFFLLTIGLFWACNHQPEVKTLSGTIIGADGKAPALAHVHLLHLGSQPYNPLKTVTAQKNGHFSMPMPQGNYWQIYVTAADHQALLLPLLTDDPNESVALNIRLAHNPYTKDFSQVHITGDWNRFDFSSADSFTKQADGTYLFEVESPADTVAYQLLGLVTDGRSVNGTDYDHLVYDGGGDYKSVVKVVNNKARIVFDPQKLVRVTTDNYPAVTVTKGSETVKEVYEIALKNKTFRQKEEAAQINYRKTHGNVTGFVFDRLDIKRYLSQKTKNGNTSLGKRFAALMLAGNTSPRDEDAKSIYNLIITTLPLTDELWAAEAMSCSYIFEEALGEEQAQALFKKEVKQIPNRLTQAGILVSMGRYARDKGNVETQRSIFNNLKTNYADLREIAYYVALLNPGRRIAKGKQVPDFTLPQLNSSKTISNKKLLGKYYIMDFWATWCGPCVGEMPKMHEAYKKYKSPRFTILSLSFDRNKEAIEQFRKKEWKMPWLHVFLEGGNRDTISKEFEVSGIPKPILVDPKGKIVATEGELRGDDLDVTLAKFLRNER